MQLFNYSFIILFLSFSNSYALERFSSKQCLEKNFQTKINFQGPLFGFFDHLLVITKKHCLMTIKHKKYLPKEWIVDVCREPVHIKVSSIMGVDVAKKEHECIKPDKTKDTSDFCSQYFELLDVIQDDGLIFAEGDRDNIDTPHGKTYCTYLLLQRYLNDSRYFSRYTEVESIFEKSPSEMPRSMMTPKKNSADTTLPESINILDKSRESIDPNKAQP
jgi:hypothetical protein